MKHTEPMDTVVERECKDRAMTVENVLAKIHKGYPVYRDLVHLVQAARDKGFEEGETKQALLEFQSRDRFLAECACEKCGGHVTRKPSELAAEPMTVENLIEKLALGRYDGDRHWDDLRSDVFDLVLEQARRDAELVSESGGGGARAMCDTILESAGLQGEGSELNA